MKARRSEVLSTRYRIAEQTLIVDFGSRMRVLSSAPKRGGLQTARYLLNHQVPAGPVRQNVPSDWEHPARYLRRIAETLGVDQSCVALMTAVPMKRVVTSREMRHGIWVECLATVGVTNAVRAGEPPGYEPGSSMVGTAGTINLILVTNACLAMSALVGAVQVATESKTGVLRDHAVPSWTGRPGATGTGTDAVVVACAQRGRGPRHLYAGTHTDLGSMIGLVVADCLTQGLARANQWTADHSI